MPTILEYERGAKDAVCTCGRPKKPPHCPACGVRNVYARRASDLHIETEGGIVLVHGFRCRSCGIDFNEAMACEAPGTQSMRTKRLVEDAEEKMAVALRHAGGDRARLGAYIVYNKFKNDPTYSMEKPVGFDEWYAAGAPGAAREDQPQKPLAVQAEPSRPSEPPSVEGAEKWQDKNPMFAPPGGTDPKS